MEFEKISNCFESLQDDICEQLQAVSEGGFLIEDIWNRETGGGGRSRVMEGNKVFEKAGVTSLCHLEI